jgi:DNA-binding NtrC family response regulator
MGEDVLLIAKDMIGEFNREFGSHIEGFTDEAVAKLLDHSWPGNVRELRNVLERAMIFAGGTRIEAADLTLATPDSLGGSAYGDDAFCFPMGKTLKDVERAYIRRTLEEDDSSYADIADSLGISKKTLWDKRKRYDLDEVVDR